MKQTPAETIRQLVEEILTALEALRVGASRSELWFEPAATPGVQVRLSVDASAPSFDRSANFGISYGGEAPNETGLSAFRAAVELIKRLDHQVIDGAATVFASLGPRLLQERTPTSAAAVSSVETAGGRGWSGRVVVVGGGTAGYFAALALKEAFAECEVTLVESSKIPIIGVGEATTTLMPPFLHRQLGIDVVELYREVRPTWKLGIKFDWGLPGDYYFNYAFGDSFAVEAFAHDGDIARQSVGALLMAADRTPIVIGDDGQPVSLLTRMSFAYHLENKSFVVYLAKLGKRAGIEHIDAEITEVRRSAEDGSVASLRLDDGRELSADLYVDASGFRSLLIEKTLGSPFLSYASTLFCDRAIVAEVPQRGAIQPYTTAQTMDAGWCWRIPVEGEDHRGYVHSSAHLSEEQARDEMRAKNPGLGDTWTVRFRSGRHQDFWKGNVVAVGNAYGFVEPLESTALHMVIIEIAALIEGLHDAAAGAEPDRAAANRSIGMHWDYLRWFLGIHYKFNRKLDTEFWRACRASVDVSGIEPLLERFRTQGFGAGTDGSVFRYGDPIFNQDGIAIMLLGQQVPCPPPQRTVLSKPEWEARVAQGGDLVRRALGQAQALEVLRRRPDLLQEAVTLESSWMAAGMRGPSGEWAKLRGLVSGASGRQRQPSASARPEAAPGPWDHLFQALGMGSGR